MTYINDTTITVAPAIPQFVTVPTVRVLHSIIGIFKREHDTVGCIASRPVELVLCEQRTETYRLREWHTFSQCPQCGEWDQEFETVCHECAYAEGRDVTFEDWLDSLEGEFEDYEYDPRWSELADVSYDEYKEMRLG